MRDEVYLRPCVTLPLTSLTMTAAEVLADEFETLL
jgi:hypothetical protein